MEIVKPRKDLLYFVGTSVFIASLLIFFFFMPIIHYLFYVHWGFLFLAILFFLFPLHQKKLGEIKIFSPWQVMLRTIAMQLCLLAFHAAFFSQPYSRELISYGLFPWAWVAILASAFGCISYFKKENASANTLLTPLIKIPADKPLGIVANNLFKFFHSSVFCVIFAFMILLIPKIFGADFTPPYTQAIPLFGILALLIFSFTKFYNRIFMRISAYPLALSMSLLILFCGLILLILNFISSGPSNQIPLPESIQALRKFPLSPSSSILSLGFWMGISIISSLYLARIFKGYSRRSLIGITLFLPIVLAFIFTLAPTFELPIVLKNTMGIFGFIGIMILFTNRKMLSPFVLNTIPKNGENKYRNPEFLLRKIFQMSLIFLYIYLPIGLIIPAALISLSLFLFLIFALLLFINLCIRFRI